MDTHRRQIDPESKGKLTPDLSAKLDRLATLAAEDPKIRETINEQLRTNAILQIGELSPDELEALHERTKARKVMTPK